MFGMVLASVGTPFAPWQAEQSCAFPSMSAGVGEVPGWVPWACAGAARMAATPAAMMVDTQRDSMVFPPVWAFRSRMAASIGGCRKRRNRARWRGAGEAGGQRKTIPGAETVARVEWSETRGLQGCAVPDFSLRSIL